MTPKISPPALDFDTALADSGGSTLNNDQLMFLNCGTKDDLEAVRDRMQEAVANINELKRAVGQIPTRKVKLGFQGLALFWRDHRPAVGDDRVRKYQEDAAVSLLDLLGLGAHMAMITETGGSDVASISVVACRVNHTDGSVAPPAIARAKLSDWSQDYQSRYPFPQVPYQAPQQEETAPQARPPSGLTGLLCRLRKMLLG